MSTEPLVARKTYPALAEPKPEAIVVHCSDPRLQPAFAEFIAHELRLQPGAYIPIVVGGGAGVLGHPEHLPKEFKFLRDRFEHYRQVFPSVRRIILINHEGCRYYQSLKLKTLAFLGLGHKPSPEHAREDLSLVGRAFHSLLAHLGYQLELYYARYVDAERTKVVFEKVAA
jgi:hypothetical protein